MDIVTYTIAGIVVAIVGGTITALFNHKLSSRRERNAARRNAASHFRAAVLTALNGLYPLPEKWPREIDHLLRSAFPALQIAVAAFRPLLPMWRRWAFDRAWFNYRCGTRRKIDVQNYHHYMAFGNNPDAQSNFRRNVDLLLRFANL